MKSKTHKNEKGFVFVFLMILLPIGATLIIGLTITARLSYFYYEKQKTCLEIETKIQTLLIKKMKALLNLNPQAKQLRAEAQKAKIQLASALLSGKPLLIAKAKAHLLAVNTKITLFILKQNSIIQSAHIQSQKHLNEIKSRFKENQKRETHLFSFLYLIDSISIKHSPIAFSLVKTDFFIPPIYRAPFNIDIKQKHLIQWNYLVSSFPKSPIQQWLPFKFKYKAQCSATLTKRGSQWKTKILQAKY